MNITMTGMQIAAAVGIVCVFVLVAYLAGHKRGRTDERVAYRRRMVADKRLCPDCLGYHDADVVVCPLVRQWGGEA